MKSEIEGLSTQLRENKALIDENRSQAERQASELSSFKKGRQELVDQMIKLQNQRAALEKTLSERERRLKALEEELAPVSTLKEDLRQAQARLAETEQRSSSLEGIGAYGEGLEGRTDTEAIEATRALIAQKEGRLAGADSDAYLRMELADLRYNLGLLLVGSDPLAAIAELGKAVELNPMDAEAHYNIAVIYDVKLKDFSSAREHYRKYLVLAPDAPDAKKIKHLLFLKELEGRLKA